MRFLVLELQARDGTKKEICTMVVERLSDVIEREFEELSDGEWRVIGAGGPLSNYAVVKFAADKGGTSMKYGLMVRETPEPFPFDETRPAPPPVPPLAADYE